MTKRHAFPNGAKFAFTIFDDTDNATIENIKPVYDLLINCNIKITKSIWVYPPRGNFKGDCLLDHDYREFIEQLLNKGFEIGSHNVGDGVFYRDEILNGYTIFKNTTGYFPSIHTNHVSNPDNLYWWDKRFEWPVSFIYRLIAKNGNKKNAGESINSQHFWGDFSKKHIKYIRNLTFNGVNTLSSDPRMPYQIERNSKFSNFWFSSSDGHSLEEFNHLTRPENIDKLESENGVCIIYTHLASNFVDAHGNVDPTFKKNIEYISKKNGWFVPVSQILDHLALVNSTTQDPGYLYKLKINIRWLIDRCIKKIRFSK
jgi:hypothetical protein